MTSHGRQITKTRFYPTQKMQPQGAKSDICTYTKHIQNLLPASLHLHLKRVVLLGGDSFEGFNDCHLEVEYIK